jgi:hypothetical protein
MYSFQDGDGRISAAEVKVYTDIFLEDCGDSETAKARLLAVFKALDLVEILKSQLSIKLTK